MKGVGDAFRNLADTLETIETDETIETEYDITCITPIKDNLVAEGSISVDLEVLVPFVDSASVDDKADLVLSDVELTDDGSLRVDLRATVNRETECDERLSNSRPEKIEGTADQGTNRESELEAEGEESEENTVDEQEPAVSGTKSNRATETEADADVPPYRNPDRLREVYEACDTFAEMTDELAVDVTSQTVRRYMIKHDIHEPSSRNSTADSLLDASPDSVFANETSAKGSSGSPHTALADGNGQEADISPERGSAIENAESDSDISVSTSDRDAESGSGEEGEEESDNRETADRDEAPSDGQADEPEMESELDEPTDELDGQITDTDVELPDHLSLDQIKEAVRRSKTLYEAQRELELGRDETRQLLQDLNLLNLVHGRLSTRHLEERTIDEINRRIRSAAARERA